MKEYNSIKYRNKRDLFYVYMHVYKDKVIYIGKGSRYRASNFGVRSKQYRDYINKIGKENIKIYIIEESFDEKLVIQLETLTHKLFLDKGYKLFSKPQFGEYGCLKGRTFSKETRYKLSQSRLGKKHTEETKVKIGNARRGTISTLRKDVVQLALDNTFIKEYDNIRKLDELGFHNSAIVMCCKGKRNKHKGYKWMYKEDYINSIFNRRI